MALSFFNLGGTGVSQIDHSGSTPRWWCIELAVRQHAMNVSLSGKFLYYSFYSFYWLLPTIGGFACSRLKFLERFWPRTHGRGEEPLLSSGWTLIGSELSSPNFDLSVRAERSFAIRYLNIVIKPFCGNLDICLNYYFQSQIATESERCFFGSRFSVALLRNLADFVIEIHFSREKHTACHALSILTTYKDFFNINHCILGDSVRRKTCGTGAGVVLHDRDAIL